MILDIWLSLNKSVMQRIQKRLGPGWDRLEPGWDRLGPGWDRLGQAGTRLVLFDWQRGLCRGTSERPSFYRGLLMPV